MSNAVPFLHVDAFTDVPFAGNPAAVVLLESAREPAWMQQVAAEMNLSETAFVVPIEQARFGLRWFTPTCEVPLCGHATMAAFAALIHENKAPSRVTFDTASGPLHLERAGNEIAMSLPTYPATPIESGALVDLLGVKATEVRLGGSKFKKLLVEVATEGEVASVRPRFDALLAADNPHGVQGIVLTARGNKVDFVLRCFVPWVGIDEDPVTGGVHSFLGPYWSERLGERPLRARQLSRRGGSLTVTRDGDRVVLRASCVVVSRGALLA